MSARGASERARASKTLCICAESRARLPNCFSSVRSSRHDGTSVLAIDASQRWMSRKSGASAHHPSRLTIGPAHAHSAPVISVSSASTTPGRARFVRRTSASRLACQPHSGQRTPVAPVVGTRPARSNQQRPQRARPRAGSQRQNSHRPSAPSASSARPSQNQVCGLQELRGAPPVHHSLGKAPASAFSRRASSAACTTGSSSGATGAPRRPQRLPTVRSGTRGLLSRRSPSMVT